MSKKSPWFVALCPACSKRNQFEVTTLGRTSNCQFCDKQFKAVCADSSSAALNDPLDYWIEFTAHGLISDESSFPGPGEFGQSDNKIGKIGRTPR